MFLQNYFLTWELKPDAAQRPAERMDSTDELTKKMVYSGIQRYRRQP